MSAASNGSVTPAAIARLTYNPRPQSTRVPTSKGQRLGAPRPILLGQRPRQGHSVESIHQFEAGDQGEAIHPTIVPDRNSNLI